MKLHLWFSCATSIAMFGLASTTVADTSVEIGYRDNWQLASPEKRDGLLSIKVYVKDPNATPDTPPDITSGPPLFNNQGPAAKTDFWEVSKIKDGKAEPLEFEVRTHAAAYSLDLAIKGEVEKGLEYQAKIKDGNGPDELLLPGFTVANKDEARVGRIKPSDARVDFLTSLGGLAAKPDFSIQQGEDGVYSLKLLAGFENWGENDAHWGGKALLDADITLNPKDEGRFLSKIVGEVDALYSFKFGGWDETPLAFRARQQLGFNSRIETDQLFDNTNISLGVTSWTAVNGRLLHEFSNLFCVLGSKPEVTPPPLINLSYELVEKVKRDAESRARSIDRTTDRVRLQLYWQLQLGHKFVELFETPYNLTVVIDSGIAYDFGNEQTVPDVNLALEFGPHRPNKTVPTFVLSYVNGKTATKFENYSEVLGGLKWRW